MELKITLAPSGDAVLEGIERFTGFDAAGAKAALEQVDARGRKQVVEQGLSRSFRGLTLDEVHVDGERQTGEPLVIRYRARVPGLARPAGGRLVIEAVPYAIRLSGRYAQLGARETPLLLGADERVSIRVSVVPPPGAAPQPAAARDVAGPHGRYRRAEKVEGGALVREDSVEVLRARIPPAEYPSFARFVSEVDEAQGAPMDLGSAPAP